MKKKDTNKPKNRRTPTYNTSKIRSFSPKKQAPGEAEHNKIRLNRYISNAGVCSRRQADKLIEAGEIKVNGKVVTELGHKVLNTDRVSYKDKLLKTEKKVYVLLNKPKGFISTSKDPKNRKTVLKLVENACAERIYSVGRLDRNTTGLLLFTNDGDLAKKLSHPSEKIQKIYHLTLDKPLKKSDFTRISTEGVVLEDGPVPIDGISVLSDDMTTFGLELHSGKNRVVRRIFEHYGYTVVKLDRAVFAGLTKVNLPRGRWRYLTEKELIQLKYFKGLH